MFSANLRSNLCSCRKTKISNVFCYGDRFHKLSKTCLDLVICCKRTTKQKGNDAIVGENNKLRFLSQKKNGNLCLTQFSWKNSCGLAQDYWPLGVGIVIEYQNYRLYNILFAYIERFKVWMHLNWWITNFFIKKWFLKKVASPRHMWKVKYIHIRAISAIFSPRTLHCGQLFIGLEWSLFANVILWLFVRL